MEADGLHDTLDALVTTLRVTLRTELTSIWLPIQFGAIALSAFAAWACARTIRRRFDLVGVTMGWPGWLRVLTRALIDNFGVLAFMLILGLVRTAIRSWWRSRRRCRTALGWISSGQNMRTDTLTWALRKSMR